jgi:glycerol uptake facilitator-like aquaporin
VGLWFFVELLGSASLMLAALAYWSPAIREFLNGLAPWLLLIGLSLFFIYVVKLAWGTVRDPAATRSGKLLVSVTGAGFLILVHAPLMWFGLQLLVI